jgi:hypothetical protein
LHSAKRAASRLNQPPTTRARGDALGLVDLVLSKKEFKTRTILDHVAPQAFGFAAALLVRRTEKAKRRVWLLCPDVKTQDHVHAELGVWQCPPHETVNAPTGYQEHRGVASPSILLACTTPSVPSLAASVLDARDRRLAITH